MNAQSNNSNNSNQAKSSNNKNRPKKRFFNKNKNRKPNNSKSNRPKGNKIIINTFEDYLKQHTEYYLTYLAKRKIYQEGFFKFSPPARAKKEADFQNSLKVLRQFEDNVPEKFKELSDIHFGRVIKEDIKYSSNHQLPLVGESINTEGVKSANPHLLKDQIDSDFKDQTEEGQGTMEDYLAYKGQ